MCLIINKLPDQRLTTEFVNSVGGRNRDGWGIMWHNRRKQPVIKKGLNLPDFFSAYEKIKHKHLFIHFRMRTQGQICLDNAHPYKVVEGVYMMHNGTFSGFSDKDGKKSDTALFVEQKIRPILLDKGSAYAETDEFKEEVDKLAGAGNRLVFLDRTGFNIIRPAIWSATLSGIQVSNEYAYSVDNPKYLNGYNSKTHYSYSKGTNNYPANINDGYDDWDNWDGGHYYGPNSYADTVAKWEKDKQKEKDGVMGTRIPTADEVKAKVLALVAENDKDTDKTGRNVMIIPPSKGMNQQEYEDSWTKGGGDEDWSFLRESSEEAIAEMCLKDPAPMAKVFVSMRQEIMDYGYNQEKLRLSHR